MIRDLLRRSGVVVTAAPEFLARQVRLERLAEVLDRFFVRLAKQQAVPDWFQGPARIEHAMKNTVYTFPLYKVVYPNMANKPWYNVEPRKLEALCAKALGIRPEESYDFQGVNAMFWQLSVALTDAGRVDGKSGANRACYYPGGFGWLGFSFWKRSQPGNAAPNAEADINFGSPVQYRDILHELRHAYSEYCNHPDWRHGQENRTKDDTDRDYYLRQHEVTARLAELMHFVRSEIENLLATAENTFRNYLKYGKEAQGKPPGSKEAHIFEILRPSYFKYRNKLKTVFGTEAGFLAFAEDVLSRRFPELHAILKEDASDAQLEHARDTISDAMSQLYRDSLTRYKNVLPPLGDKLHAERGEHAYQYGRPQELR